MSRAISDPAPPFVLSEVTDPDEIARMDAMREKADRNRQWFQDNLTTILERHRGQYVCIAGEELFAADDLPTAFFAAKAKHPDDEGRICHFIPLVPKPSPPPLKITVS